jgi:hypothetical protein
MILFTGDRWLEKLSSLFVEFFPAERVAFRPVTDDAAVLELESEPGVTIIATSGSPVLSRNAAAVEVPRLMLDGLSSLEVFGQKLAGGDYLPDELPPRDRARAAEIIARNELDFGCAARLRTALATISAAGPVGRATAAFIDENYRDRNLMHGIDRPNPVLTVAIARIVADRIGLNGAIIDRREPWRTDHVAYKEATRVLLPPDADALGLRTRAGSRWYEFLLRLIEVSYDPKDQRRPALLDERPDAASRRAWLKQAAAGRVVSPVATLFLRQKQGDVPAIIAEQLRLLEQWSFISPAGREIILASILRWFPVAGRAEEGIDHALNCGTALSAHVARKLLGVAASSLEAEPLAALIPRLRARPEFADLQISKLEQRTRPQPSRARL